MPRGGRRAGAGRPKGSQDKLPRGAVAAIKALRHRVPEGTPEPLADVADEAFATVVEVMRGEVLEGARERLSAAAAVREEVCGPIPKKTEVSGKDGGALEVVIRDV